MLYSLILCTSFHLAISFNPLLLGNINDVSLSHILTQFKHFDFVVHVDEPKARVLSFINDETTVENAITIFKYSKSRYLFTRPNVARCVHYVLQEDEGFFLSYYAHRDGNVQEGDVVIFLAKVLDVKRNFTALYYSGVDTANIAFYLNRTHGFSIYFYNSPRVEADVRALQPNKHGRINLDLLHNDFRNFHGFPLKIGFTNCRPYVYKRAKDQLMIGVEHKVMEIVVDLLNFTPHYEDYSHKINGRLMLINDVNKSVLHCAFGCLSNNFMRNEKVSFTAMIQAEPHIIIYSSGNRYSPMSIYVIFHPLDGYVWICCIFTLLLVSLSVKLMLNFEGTHDSINPVLLSLSILLEQSTAIPPKNNALRFGLVTWILVGFALSSSYKSKLTSALIMPQTREPADLKSLIDDQYNFISPAEDSTFIMEVLQLSNDPLEKFVGNSAEDAKDVCEAIMRVSKDYLAIVEEQTVLRYMVWNYCHYNLTLRQMHKMRRLPHAITINGHMWAMSKSAPYKNRFSFVIETLKSHGLIQKWYRSYNISRPLSHSNSVKQRGVMDPLEKHDLVAAFAVLATGSFLSSLVFFFESCVCEPPISIDPQSAQQGRRRQRLMTDAQDAALNNSHLT